MRLQFIQRLFVLFFGVTSVSAFAAPTPPKVPSATQCGAFSKSVSSGSASQKLHRFLDTQWKYQMTEYPESATFVGYPGQNDRWTDQSLSAIARRQVETRCQLEALQKISPKALNEKDRLTWDLAVRELKESIEGEQFDGEYLALDHMNGLHSDLPDVMMGMPKNSVKAVEDMIARLEKVPQLEEQVEVLLREGLRRNVTPVKQFLLKVPAQFDSVVTPKAQNSPLYKAFEDLSALAPEEQTRLRTRALQVIESQVYPALRKLRTFLESEYIPKARESISWSEMPNGQKWYAYLTRIRTTTNHTPEQLHSLGLSEVERIQNEMKKILEKVQFRGDLKTFNEFLLKDPQFYYKTPEELMTAYRDVAKRADPELPALFKRLPRLPYGVKAIPDYKAAHSPTAYYQPGSLEAGRAGFFEANTSDLSARPKWGMEVLTLHEAVPGHHLQIALAQEIEDLPLFRRNGGYTAFSEGWGLYAESLGEKMGFYQDPYSKYGQLSYELWRAVRLVVDTGVHAKGWNRQQALDYFRSLLPKSQSESEVEVDRYITWPGQALAYKVGQMKFLELRKRAESQLGDKFDIREFHDEVLRHGAIPLDTLETLCHNWISQKLAAKPSVKGDKTGQSQSSPVKSKSKAAAKAAPAL